MKLAGRTAIITGAGSGLGFAAAKRFAEEGVRVVIADVANAPSAAASLTAKGHAAIGIDTDVTSETSVAAMVERAIAEFGAVDILVNNAAIASALVPAPFEQLSLADVRRVLDVNVVGVLLCTRAVASHMRGRKSGRIINMASVTAIRGAPMMLHYVASKGAVIAMTKSLSRELGPDDITVNAVAPGYTLTEANLANADMVAAVRSDVLRRRSLPRDAYPEDIIGALTFLAGDDAAFISGQIIVVDGGPV
jgi:NAD(P)-dependent dehydrogenase (short-subunit alcohol dehydrogenase family)